jgi:hypothetical protein
LLGYRIQKTVSRYLLPFGLQGGGPFKKKATLV